MGGTNLAKFATSIKNTVVKHGPEILTGFGIAGMGATVIFTAKPPSSEECPQSLISD